MSGLTPAARVLMREMAEHETTAALLVEKAGELASDVTDPGQQALVLAACAQAHATLALVRVEEAVLAQLNPDSYQPHAGMESSLPGVRAVP